MYLTTFQNILKLYNISHWHLIYHYLNTEMRETKITTNLIPQRLVICLRVGREGRKEMVYLMMHSTHFIYGYIASGIWSTKTLR